MTNVCSDQKTFNKAIRKAIDHIDDEEEEYKKKNPVATVILSLVMFIFYLWALLLAVKITDKEQRIVHIVLAFLTGPVYVMAYYIGMLDVKQ